MIWLERYLDEAKKFRFDTYEVEANVEEVIRTYPFLNYIKEDKSHYKNFIKKNNHIIGLENLMMPIMEKMKLIQHLIGIIQIIVVQLKI